VLTAKAIHQVLDILRHQYGDTGTALKFRTPFQLLIATMMAAQSTDKQVNKITDKLFAEHPTPESFLELSVEELEEKIKQVGLYRNKARNILATAKMIVEEFGGQVPRTRQELMRLPGVGRKTANVVLSVGFNHDAIAVDTHVFRVANRIGLARANDPLNTEKQLMENIPQKQWSAAHHWLIWHGRRICRAQNPRCDICPLTAYCEYYRKTSGESMPQPS